MQQTFENWRTSYMRWCNYPYNSEKVLILHFRYDVKPSKSFHFHFLGTTKCRQCKNLIPPFKLYPNAFPTFLLFSGFIYFWWMSIRYLIFWDTEKFWGMVVSTFFECFNNSWTASLCPKWQAKKNAVRPQISFAFISMFRLMLILISSKVEPM